MDEDLLKLLGLMIGVFVVARLISLLTTPTVENRKQECKIHKWSINPATNKLQCTDCNLVAGTTKTEHGDY